MSKYQKIKLVRAVIWFGVMFWVFVAWLGWWGVAVDAAIVGGYFLFRRAYAT